MKGRGEREEEFNITATVVVARKKRGCKRDDDCNFCDRQFGSLSSISFYQFHGFPFPLFRAMSALSDVTNAAPVAKRTEKLQQVRRFLNGVDGASFRRTLSPALFRSLLSRLCLYN